MQIELNSHELFGAMQAQVDQLEWHIRNRVIQAPTQIRGLLERLGHLNDMLEAAFRSESIDKIEGAGSSVEAAIADRDEQVSACRQGD